MNPDDWNSLTEKLRQLGLRFNQPSPPAETPPQRRQDISEIVTGHELENLYGKVFSAHSVHAGSHRQGRESLAPHSPLKRLCRWALCTEELRPEDFLFLDTETTGLSGGTGTLAFMVGAARFEGENLLMERFFLRGPEEEAALLAALEGFSTGVKAIVSYNGKSFDLPLLRNRFIMQGMGLFLADCAHFDLLHLCRSIWRSRLGDCSLGNIETQILGFVRKTEDIPGYLIPELYRDYLLRGSCAPLEGVFYHNQQDVLSLVALFSCLASILEQPEDHPLLSEHDIPRLGRLFEKREEPELATMLYTIGSDKGQSDSVRLQALLARASQLKREDRSLEALPLWQEATRLGSAFACEELAKVYEHRLKDLPAALRFTEMGLSLLEAEAQKQRWDLLHRKTRLLSLIEKSNRN